MSEKKGPAPGLSREWTDSEVMELIHLYEEQEFLWNVKHTLYRNRDKKMSMFDEFGKKFNCDGSEVQRKMHNLRNQVSHELQKMKKLKSGDGAEERYESKWKFFSALKFIVPNFTPTKSTSNINNTVENSEIAEEEQKDEPRAMKRKTPSKKPSKTQEDDILKEAIQILKKPKDDFDQFGEYVSMELRNLKSDYYRGQLKSAIRKAIYIYLSDIDERRYWFSAPSSSNSGALSPSPSPSVPVDNYFPPFISESINQSTQIEKQSVQSFYNSFGNNFVDDVNNQDVCL